MTDTEDTDDQKLDYRTREGRLAKARQEQEAAARAMPDRSASRTTYPRSEGVHDARPVVRSDGTVIGRNGEVLSRTQPDNTADIYSLLPGMEPDGWKYQWNVVSVVGNTDMTLRTISTMNANGWRSVPADRHPGHWTPMGYRGDIIVGGLRLEERPEILCDQARRDEELKARKQMNDRDQSLMGGKANLRNSMPTGFAMGGQYRKTGGDLRMSIDRGLDIPTPQYQPADDSK